MNERIKQLIEQATSPSHRSQGFGGEPTHIYPGTLDPEKLAELILHDVLSQNILQAQRVDKDPVCQNYPKEVIAGFFYADMLKRYGVE